MRPLQWPPVLMTAYAAITPHLGNKRKGSTRAGPHVLYVRTIFAIVYASFIIMHASEHVLAYHRRSRGRSAAITPHLGNNGKVVRCRTARSVRAHNICYRVCLKACICLSSPDQRPQRGLTVVGHCKRTVGVRCCGITRQYKKTRHVVVPLRRQRPWLHHYVALIRRMYRIP